MNGYELIEATPRVWRAYLDGVMYGSILKGTNEANETTYYCLSRNGREFDTCRTFRKAQELLMDHVTGKISAAA
jgi:hypothetical protein